jgi:hypothetical protein
MPSLKIVFVMSAMILAVYLIDDCVGSPYPGPYPSIGTSKGKSKKIGNCALLIFILRICELRLVAEQKKSF